MKKFLSIFMVFAICFSLVACGTTNNTSSGNTTNGNTSTNGETGGETGGETTGDPLLIGTFQPLTGTNAEIGENQVNGQQLAINQINANGGLNGQMLEMITYDSQGVPEEAVKACQRLVEVDGIDFMMGDLISSNMLATGEYLNENQILTFGTGLSSTWMEQGWEYIWRACVNNGTTMPILAEKLIDMGVNSVGVLHGQDDANNTAYEVFAEKYEELGGTITTAETYVEGDSDFSGQIAKILNTSPDAVLLCSHSSIQGSFMRQLRSQGFLGLAMCKEPFTSADIELSGASSDNVAFIYPYVTYSDPEDCEDEQIKQFLIDYQAEFGKMPTHDCAYRGYDAMMALAEACTRAGSNDTAAVLEALGTINDLDGLIGTLDFTQGDREGVHNATAGFVVLDGKYVDIDSWIADGGYDALKNS